MESQPLHTHTGPQTACDSTPGADGDGDNVAVKPLVDTNSEKGKGSLPNEEEAQEEEDGLEKSFYRLFSSRTPMTFANHKLKFKIQNTVGFLKLKDTPPEIETDGKIKDTHTEEEVKPGEILAFEDILNFNGANLSIGYHEEGHKAVQDFSQFHVLKQLYFRKLLVDQKYFQTAAAQGEPPSFVAMAGEIVSILMTPFTKWERWGFYGVRYEDVIFLYNSIPEKRLAETIQGYAGKVYKSLVTGEKPKDNNDFGVNLDEFNATFEVTETTFGDYKLLLMSSGEIDQEGKKVAIRAYNPQMQNGWRLKTKFLTYWGSSAVACTQGMLLGIRNNEHILQDSKLLTLDNLWEETGNREFDSEVCYIFLNNTFRWIRSQFPEDDRFKVKEFSWAGVKDKKWNGKINETPYAVCCKTLPEAESREISERILPDWFVQGAFNN